MLAAINGRVFRVGDLQIAAAFCCVSVRKTLIGQPNFANGIGVCGGGAGINANRRLYRCGVDGRGRGSCWCCSRSGRCRGNGRGNHGYSRRWSHCYFARWSFARLAADKDKGGGCRNEHSTPPLNWTFCIIHKFLIFWFCDLQVIFVILQCQGRNDKSKGNGHSLRPGRILQFVQPEHQHIMSGHLGIQRLLCGAKFFLHPQIAKTIGRRVKTGVAL